MKICVIGDGLVAKEFQKSNFVVINKPFDKFKLDYIIKYDVCINTYDYKGDDIGKMCRCNVELPKKLSDFCSERRKRFVHLSTTSLYSITGDNISEDDNISAINAYQSSKLLGEKVCGPKGLIIRTNNIMCDAVDDDNVIYQIMKNHNPSKNKTNFTWTMDLIRGIVTLLKKKKTGIFNITSEGCISPYEIASLVGLNDITPIIDDTIPLCACVSNGKLNRHMITDDALTRSVDCFAGVIEELKGI